MLAAWLGRLSWLSESPSSVLLCYAKAKPSAALRQSNAAGRSGAASRGAAWVGDERAEREWREEGRGERGETAVASQDGKRVTSSCHLRS